MTGEPETPIDPASAVLASVAVAADPVEAVVPAAGAVSEEIAAPAEASEAIAAPAEIAKEPALPAKRGRKSRQPAAAAIKPDRVPADTPASAKPAPAQPARATAAAARLPKATPKPSAKRRYTRKAAAQVAPVRASQEKVPARALPTKSAAVSPPKYTPKNDTVAAPTPWQLKEKLMTQTIPADFIAPFQTAFSDIQEKARSAYEKSTEALGEANDFAKGNVEALVESSKLLASGLQELGSIVVADSRSAFETITADVKELAAVKTPAEFFQLQSVMLRKSFDGAVAQASKNTEAVMKLATEALLPISSRVSLAVEKVSKAA